MSKFEAKLSRWNFKKIARVYLVVLVLAALGCAAALGAVYRSRISFAWQYARVSEAAHHRSSADLQEKLGKLAASSSDVVDVLVLDKSNNVTYSAKNSPFASGQFNLSPAGEYREYLASKADSRVVFRHVRGDDFMLHSVFNKDFGEIRDEYREESFFENGFGDKTVYLLSFLGDKDGGSKIYIISNPTTVAGGMLTLKITATAAILLFMIYWVLLAFWAYQNAAKSKLYAPLWGIVVLLTNLAGFLVYQIYKHANATCPSCGASQSRLHRYCVNCGAKLGAVCKNCGAQVGKKDQFCSNCGTKID